MVSGNAFKYLYEANIAQAVVTMSGDDVVAAGATNLGLKDQRLALQWINQNVVGFGGLYTNLPAINHSLIL
jgi:hypothetical protein